MRQIILIISTFISTISSAQVKNVAGTFVSVFPDVRVIFNEDSTFQYMTEELHPTFYRWENFSEKGKWSVSGDTIVLNPQLTKKIFIESDFSEKEDTGRSNLFLTFNHIKRYFDSNGDVVGVAQANTDTGVQTYQVVWMVPEPGSAITFVGFVLTSLMRIRRQPFG